MSDQKPDSAKEVSLTDGEIVTERKLPRRAFLSTTGGSRRGGDEISRSRSSILW